jgi:hypothetical protein
MEEIGVVCPQRRYQQDVPDQKIDAFEVQGGYSNCISYK